MNILNCINAFVLTALATLGSSTASNLRTTDTTHRDLFTSCSVLPAEGLYFIELELSGNRLGVEDASTMNLGNVIQTSFSGSAATWGMEAVGDGTYRAVNKNSGKILAVQNGSLEDGGNAVQQNANSPLQDSTHWCFVAIATVNGKVSYTIQNKLSAKFLQVDDSETNSGTNVYQSTSNGGMNQRFMITQACVSFPVNTYHHITAFSTGMQMAVRNNNMEIGGNIRQEIVTNATLVHDEWLFVPVGDGYSRILSRSSGLAANGAGSSVKQQPEGLSLDDQWCLFRTGSDHYQITNRPDRKPMVVSDDSINVFNSNNYDGDNHIWTVSVVSDNTI